MTSTFYLGGSNAYCNGASSGISNSWFTSVRSMGYGLVGIWVGPQCCGGAGYISTNPTTARNQGIAEANGVYSALSNFNEVNGNFPLVYDIESNSNTTAVNAFLGGWVQQLHNSGFPWVGAYGSVCGSQVPSWTGASPVPDFVWTGDWQSPARNTVWGLDCLSDGYWWWDQRHNQYRNGHYSSWNGVTMWIDSTCANGQVWAAPSGVGYGDLDSGGESGGGPSEDDAYWCGGGVL